MDVGTPIITSYQTKCHFHLVGKYFNFYTIFLKVATVYVKMCAEQCYFFRIFFLTNSVNSFYFYINDIMFFTIYYLIIPSPTKLQRDIVTLPSVLPSFCPSAISL